MGSIRFEADAVGMSEILKDLDAVGDLPRTAAKALRAGAEVLLPAARDLAPVRTGELKGALKIGRRTKVRDRYAVEVGAFHGDAPHAHLVERGHGGPKPAPAYPFMEPAVEMKEQEILDAIMGELMKGLGKG